MNTHAYQSAKNRFPTFNEILDYWNTIRKLRSKYPSNDFPIPKLIDEKSLNQFFWRMLWLFYPELTYIYLDILKNSDPKYPRDCLQLLESCFEVFSSIANDGVYSIITDLNFREILDQLSYDDYIDDDYFDMNNLFEFYERIKDHIFLYSQKNILQLHQFFTSEFTYLVNFRRQITSIEINTDKTRLLFFISLSFCYSVYQTKERILPYLSGIRVADRI